MARQQFSGVKTKKGEIILPYLTFKNLYCNTAEIWQFNIKQEIL